MHGRVWPTFLADELRRSTLTNEATRLLLLDGIDGGASMATSVEGLMPCTTTAGGVSSAMSSTTTSAAGAGAAVLARALAGGSSSSSSNSCR